MVLVNSFTLWILDLLECHWCVAVHVTFWALVASTATGWVDLPDSTPAAVTVFVLLWMALAATTAWCFGIESKLFHADD